MTAGELYKHELLRAEFGDSACYEAAKRVREIYPDAKVRKEEVGHYDIATFLYIMASIKGPKDVYRSLQTLTKFGNDNEQTLPFILMGNFIHNPDLMKEKELIKIEISTDTGASTIYYKGRPPICCPEDISKFNPPKKLVENINVIKPELLRELGEAYRLSNSVYVSKFYALNDDNKEAEEKALEDHRRWKEDQKKGKNKKK